MRSDIESIFPLGPATGASFVGREAVLGELLGRIHRGQHTWIRSNRGWGKDSLIWEAARRAGIHLARADLGSIHDSESLVYRVKEAVQDVAGMILPSGRDALPVVEAAFGRLHPELILNVEGGYKLWLSFHVGLIDPTESLRVLLSGLDQITKRTKSRLLMVLDQFPNIKTIKDSRKIETNIRNQIQGSQCVTYIATASNSHSLEQVFGDSDSEYHKLMDPLVLGRVEDQDYKRYLTAQSKRKWKRTLDDEAISEILDLTNRHPLYVNLICRRLWQLSALPKISQIQEMWKEIIIPFTSLIRNEISALAPNQRAVIVALANMPVHQIVSADMVRRVRLAASSIQQAVRYLEQKGFIFRDDVEGYTVVDPAIQWVLKGKIKG